MTAEVSVTFEAVQRLIEQRRSRGADVMSISLAEVERLVPTIVEERHAVESILYHARVQCLANVTAIWADVECQGCKNEGHAHDLRVTCRTCGH